MNDEKEFYTVYEMAARVGRSAKTVYNWINAGNIPAYTRKDGNKECTLVSQADVDEFLRPQIAEAAKGGR